jgi:hypothetical protein
VNFLARTAEYFRAHPNEWLDARTFEGIGGRQAWRSRIAECRTKCGMDIENEVKRIVNADGSIWTRSRYRYVPKATAQHAERF